MKKCIQFSGKNHYHIFHIDSVEGWFVQTHSVSRFGFAAGDREVASVSNHLAPIGAGPFEVLQLEGLFHHQTIIVSTMIELENTFCFLNNLS